MTVRATTAARSAVLGAAALVLSGASLSAQEWLETTTARQITGETAVEMKIEYGAGRLRVEPAPSDLLYRARVRYRSDRFEPIRSYARQDGSARVRLGLTSDGQELDLHLDWSDLDVELGDLDDLEGEDYEGSLMAVGVTPELPVDLEVVVGAAESRLDLGGLRLTSLSYTTGASDTRLTFDEPNPATMDRLAVKMGAAALRVEGLGNAGARAMRFEGGVGELTLDFTGRWERDASASVRVGLGSVTLRIPSSLGVSLEKRTLLSSFSALGFERVDGEYRTENWDEAEHHLDLELDAAFGSIDVEVVP